MLLTSTYAAVSLSTVILVNVVWRLIRQQRLRKQMPPGPPGAPLIGNLLQITSSGSWYRLTEWKGIYGPIFSLNLMGQPVVVLNDFSVSSDLIDRRSALYSDRPRLVMLGELMTRGMVFLMTRYNALWRSMRKASSECLSPHAVRNYRPLQQMHTYMLLSHLLKDSEHWQKHVKFAQSSMFFCVLYGLTPKELRKNPHFSETVAAFGRAVGAAAMPGSNLVDVFPWLLHLPLWLSPWKRTGNAFYTRTTAVFIALVNSARAKRNSAATSHILSIDLMKMEQDKVLTTLESSWLCGALYGGAQETSPTIIETLFLAMLVYPEKIRPIQDQIDAVVGRDRLPTFADIDDLPYVHALIREILRWRPPSPLAVPKRCMQDDHYNGYLIPKGTIVIENTWAMNHDPQYFDNPDAFEPRRHLDNTGQLLEAIPNTHGYSHASFGSGRRICPGKDLAMQGLLITAAIVLWGAEVSPALDTNRRPIIPSPDDIVDKGVAARPAAFRCQIKPRDERVQALTDDALEDEYIVKLSA